MQLLAGTQPLEFSQASLMLSEVRSTGVFALKNNKTVAETITHRRYAHLAQSVHQSYAHCLHNPLGIFLLELKTAGDPFYRKFLNKYGDQTYCTFSIHTFVREKGVYAWLSDNILRYIGRSHDPFGKRVNQGYGRIAPKNCYLDGQATNCHLNALIAESTQTVTFYVCPIAENPTIDSLERELIQHYRPPWNIALKAS